MQFIDEAEVYVEAGKGGAGASHFRREKFVPRGGPDGGNGGRGGSVIVKADPRKHTLLDFKYKPKWKAGNGKPGEGANKDGKSGSDLVIKVPVGTQIYSKEESILRADLKEPGDTAVIAKGGLGGKGNASFKSSVRQAPTYAQPGTEGEKGVYLFSLKLVADVGLIGLPNAGKSTLISRISAAKPKIADYPFTTLTPNLGVVKAKGGSSFVVADIPGLIEGASQGKGLGIKFLKHIERTAVLAHLIDPVGAKSDDLINTFNVVNNELKEFSKALTEKPQVIVVSKLDAVPEREIPDTLKEFADKEGIPLVEISSISGEGIDELVELLNRLVFADGHVFSGSER